MLSGLPDLPHQFQDTPLGRCYDTLRAAAIHSSMSKTPLLTAGIHQDFLDAWYHATSNLLYGDPPSTKMRPTATMDLALWIGRTIHDLAIHLAYAPATSRTGARRHALSTMTANEVAGWALALCADDVPVQDIDVVYTIVPWLGVDRHGYLFHVERLTPGDVRAHRRAPASDVRVGSAGTTRIPNLPDAAQLRAADLEDRSAVEARSQPLGYAIHP